MIDWTKSMQQTFDFYVVDPETWGNKTKLELIKSCSISRDADNETLGSSSIDSTELLDECYVRTFLICNQNGIKYQFPLATHIVQTPDEKYNGRVKEITMDSYTPLLELKDNKPPYGYFVPKGANIMDTAFELISDHCRAPVVKINDGQTLVSDFVADFDNDTWLSFLTDLISIANFKFDIDEMGRILFAPKKEASTMTPIWTYDDSNSSILYADVTLSRDLYGVPNVVEVLFSTENFFRVGVAINDDDSSPISITNRGRRVVHRVSNPEGLQNPSQDQIDNYAKELLRSLSTLEYTISYSHGYCPVRVGDCVGFDYKRADLRDIRALVKSQTISCSAGCKVDEKAVFTTKLWG